MDGSDLRGLYPLCADCHEEIEVKGDGSKRSFIEAKSRFIEIAKLLHKNVFVYDLDRHFNDFGINKKIERIRKLEEKKKRKAERRELRFQQRAKERWEAKQEKKKERERALALAKEARKGPKPPKKDVVPLQINHMRRLGLKDAIDYFTDINMGLIEDPVDSLVRFIEESNRIEMNAPLAGPMPIKYLGH